MRRFGPAFFGPFRDLPPQPAAPQAPWPGDLDSRPSEGGESTFRCPRPDIDGLAAPSKTRVIGAFGGYWSLAPSCRVRHPQILASTAAHMLGFRGHAKFGVPSPTSRLWPPASAVNQGSEACPGPVHLLLCVSQRALLWFSPLCKDRSLAGSMGSGAMWAERAGLARILEPHA